MGSGGGSLEVGGRPFSARDCAFDREYINAGQNLQPAAQQTFDFGLPAEFNPEYTLPFPGGVFNEFWGFNNYST